MLLLLNVAQYVQCVPKQVIHPMQPPGLPSTSSHREIRQVACTRTTGTIGINLPDHRAGDSHGRRRGDSVPHAVSLCVGVPRSVGHVFALARLGGLFRL